VSGHPSLSQHPLMIYASAWLHIIAHVRFSLFLFACE
jgi:hypothetical protein